MSGRPASSPPTVVIADDHPATRLGVRMSLIRGGFEVAGEAEDCAGAIRAVQRAKPDVALLDIRMPGGGINAAATISRESPGTSVVMLTAYGHTDEVMAALRAGAVGYLPKDTRPDRLPAALAGVLKGEAALPRALVGMVLNEFRDFTAPAEDPIRVGAIELTSRESEVLRLLRSGLTTAEVGEALSLSPVTVRRHISAGMAKLGVADRQAALRAIGPSSAA